MGAMDTQGTKQDGTMRAVNMHQPFFKAGIVVALTAGAVWGAWLLLRIAVARNFTAVGIHEVNAHGHAQIFGWVGLFVMGFAYRVVPHFRGVAFPNPRVAWATLAMMLAGITLRSGAQAFLGAYPGLLYAGLIGSSLEIVAVGVFACVILGVLRRAAPGLALDYYLMAGVFWFFVQSVYSAVYFHATAVAPDRDALLALVATWQGPLRDVQIHGFAMMMVLGVSQHLLPHAYGLREPSARLSKAVLVLLNVAVVGEVTGLVLMRLYGYRWTGVWYLSVILLMAGVALLVRGMGVFSRPVRRDRSFKFARTAYVWLLASLVMLVLLPVHQFGLLRTFAPDSEAARIGFSHAYYGAIRHAITVGFISLMILGVASRVAPKLKGLDLNSLPALWAPFVLLNTGCFLRVFFQTATDFAGVAFPVAGVSGLLEVTAIALWGAHLWRVMSPARHSALPVQLGKSPLPAHQGQGCK